METQTHNDLLKAAYAARTRREADAEKKALMDKEFQAALEELDNRTYQVSLPTYEGRDSHARIRADRQALEAYLDEQPEAEEALEWLRREDKQESKTMTDLHAEMSAIRQQLDGGQQTSSTDLSTPQRKATQVIDVPWTARGLVD
jgi:hypothetical protein